jgi:hypothetical protein
MDKDFIDGALVQWFWKKKIFFDRVLYTSNHLLPMPIKQLTTFCNSLQPIVKNQAVLMSPANDVHFFKIENVSARLLIAKITFYSGSSGTVSH